MAREFFISKYKDSGIHVTYTKSRNVLYISAWYDNFVGIQGEEIPLEEFFKRLDIDKRSILKAIENLPDKKRKS